MDEGTPEEPDSVIIQADSPRPRHGCCDAFRQKIRSVRVGDLSPVMDDDGRTLLVQPVLFGNVARLEVREVIMVLPGPQLNAFERRMSPGPRRSSTSLGKMPPPVVIHGQTPGRSPSYYTSWVQDELSVQSQLVLALGITLASTDD